MWGTAFPCMIKLYAALLRTQEGKEQEEGKRSWDINKWKDVVFPLYLARIERLWHYYENPGSLSIHITCGIEMPLVQAFDTRYGSG
jgi:hypothetical protein